MQRKKESETPLDLNRSEVQWKQDAAVVWSGLVWHISPSVCRQLTAGNEEWNFRRLLCFSCENHRPSVLSLCFWLLSHFNLLVRSLERLFLERVKMYGFIWTFSHNAVGEKFQRNSWKPHKVLVGDTIHLNTQEFRAVTVSNARIYHSSQSDRNNLLLFVCLSCVIVYNVCTLSTIHCSFATQTMDFVTIQHVVVFTFPLLHCCSKHWHLTNWTVVQLIFTLIYSQCLSPRLLLVHTGLRLKPGNLPACAVLVTLQQDPMWMENHCILTEQVSSKTSFTSFNQHFTLIATAGVPVTRHKVTFTSCWLSGKLQLAAPRRGIKSYTHTDVQKA